MLGTIWLVPALLAIFTSSANVPRPIRHENGPSVRVLLTPNSPIQSPKATNQTHPSDASEVQVSELKAKCDGRAYGRNLDRASCFDAWNKIGFDDNRVRWGRRGRGGTDDIQLPYRWSSGKLPDDL